MKALAALLLILTLAEIGSAALLKADDFRNPDSRALRKRRSPSKRRRVSRKSRRNSRVRKNKRRIRRRGPSERRLLSIPSAVTRAKVNAMAKRIPEAKHSDKRKLALLQGKFSVPKGHVVSKAKHDGPDPRKLEEGKEAGKLEAIPLLIFGDYQIIIEKK